MRQLEKAAIEIAWKQIFISSSVLPSLFVHIENKNQRFDYFLFLNQRNNHVIKDINYISLLIGYEYN